MDEEYDAIVLGTGLKVSLILPLLTLTYQGFKFNVGKKCHRSRNYQPVVGLVIFLVGTAILLAFYCDLMLMFRLPGMYRQWHAFRIRQKGASYG